MADLLTGAPPAHWLLGSQWHQCWFLKVPGTSQHRQAVIDVLDEGSRDPERGDAAKALREVVDRQPP